MLYKVTPMLPVPEKPKRARQAGVGDGADGSKTPAQARKKRKSAIYDHEGNEVLITLMCLKCRQIKPLAQFGLRKMADGAIRNQPWCRGCRSGAGVPKPKPAAQPVVTPVDAEVSAVAEAPVAAETVSATDAPLSEPLAEPVVDAAVDAAVEAAGDDPGGPEESAPAPVIEADGTQPPLA